MIEPATHPPAAANGELVNRVQQLRLNGQPAAAAKAARGGAAWLPWVLCLLLGFAWAGWAVRGYRNAPKDAPAGAAAVSATSAGGANTAPAAPTGSVASSGAIQIEVKGYLTPFRLIAVSPIDVGGRVVELNVVEGKRFQKGEILARLDDSVYRAAVDEATAGLAAAQKRLESSRARLAGMLPASVRPVEISQVEQELRESAALRDRAKDEMDRLARLGAGVSERESRQAQFDHAGAAARVSRLEAALALIKEGPRKEQKTAAEADVRTAEAEVKVAEARLAQARWRADNCVIRSPIDGTVLTKKAELGNLVNPMAFGGTSGSVCEMADLADLEADLEIPERDISKVRVGQKCRIKADAYPERTYEGRLDRIMPIANRAKSIVNVRVKVRLPEGEAPGTYLKPEMGAVVSFLNETADK